MDDFKFTKFQVNESGESIVSIPIVIAATSKDHRDIHYLYKMRKAISLLVGGDGMKGYTEQSLVDIHTAVVRVLINKGSGHYYDEWESDLDDLLPDDLKIASSGYDPPPDQSMFDLEEADYRIILEKYDAINLWTAPTARKKVPANHFLDPKGKKYPYKNFDGTISCGGLKAAYGAARGARGAPKRPSIAIKAKSLIDKHCKAKKEAVDSVVGKLI